MLFLCENGRISKDKNYKQIFEELSPRVVKFRLRFSSTVSLAGWINERTFVSLSSLKNHLLPLLPSHAKLNQVFLLLRRQLFSELPKLF